MFRTVSLFIIRSFALYTQQAVNITCMTYTIAVLQCKTPDDGQRNCPKHVELYSENKFEKLVHLVGFVIRTSCQFLTRSKFKVNFPSHFMLYVTAYRIQKHYYVI